MRNGYPGLFGCAKKYILPLLLPLFAIYSAGAKTAENSDNHEPDPEKLARLHIEEGNPGEAIALLRGKTDTIERVLLLARAYLDDDNDFWAMRVLHEAAHEDEDCSLPLLWLAFLHISQGAVDDGLDLLDVVICPEDSESEVRRMLLIALASSTAGEDESALEALRKAAGSKKAFAEDIQALQALRPSIEPSYIRPVSGRMELTGGWTSNALAGSPLDPASGLSPPSGPLAQFSGNARLVPPSDNFARPVLDIEMRGLGIGAEAGRDLSYLQVSGRQGILLGEKGNLLAGYRFETIGILGGDIYDEGPIRFYETHRGEVEMDLQSWLTAFGGAGYRAFREGRRSRFEIDGGLGAAWRPMDTLSLLGAFMGRYHSARRDFYNLFGATAIMQAEWRMPVNISARLGITGSFDDYPDSEGFFTEDSPRRDFLARINAGLWLPRTHGGFRKGITYEFSNRFSTAPDYEYMDHRLLIRIQWAFSADPTLPVSVSPSGHVPLRWGLDEGEGGLEETIQDLLRQDEAVRAGSSCVD